MTTTDKITADLKALHLAIIRGDRLAAHKATDSLVDRSAAFPCPVSLAPMPPRLTGGV